MYASYVSERVVLFDNLIFTPTSLRPSIHVLFPLHTSRWLEKLIMWDNSYTYFNRGERL